MNSGSPSTSTNRSGCSDCADRTRPHTAATDRSVPSDRTPGMHDQPLGRSSASHSRTTPSTRCATTCAACRHVTSDRLHRVHDVVRALTATSDRHPLDPEQRVPVTGHGKLLGRHLTDHQRLHRGDRRAGAVRTASGTPRPDPPGDQAHAQRGGTGGVQRHTTPRERQRGIPAALPHEHPMQRRVQQRRMHTERTGTTPSGNTTSANTSAPRRQAARSPRNTGP